MYMYISPRARESAHRCRKTHQLAINLQVAEAEHGLDVDVFERDEAEALAPPRLAVEHDGGVDDLAELGEELAHRLGRHGAGEAADEELGRTLVLLTRDRALRVDLSRRITKIERWTIQVLDYCAATHNFAVEEVLADHDGVHGRGVLERQEREAARATGGIPHDRARLDFAEL